MSLPVLIAAMAQEFKWPHDYWRRIGWREFWSWVSSLNDLRVAEQEELKRQAAEADRRRVTQEAIDRMRRGG